MKDMTPREILDAIDKGMEKVRRQFVKNKAGMGIIMPVAKSAKARQAQRAAKKIRKNLDTET